MFKAADDRNYTLYTYVNELNQEVAKLEDQVKTIQGEIDSVQKADVAREQERQRTQQEVRMLLMHHEPAWRSRIHQPSCAWRSGLLGRPVANNRGYAGRASLCGDGSRTR
jgi:TolA-binding protein